MNSPPGISCATDCIEVVGHGTVMTLTATPALGSTFTGWSGGCCTGTGTCSVTMLAATTVTASFALNTYTLSVMLGASTGTGSVSSVPAGISCGADCSEVYNHGTSVTLTATPSANSTFSGWSGACSGSGTCTVTMTAATVVTATFAIATYPLTVTRTGSGSGSVSSSPAGITCGADCSETVNHGTVMTLTASPSFGSTFAGWSGAGCSGTGTCTVTITAATSVTATFTLNTYPLSVTRAGSGSGTVTSSPAGISCGTDCTEVVNHGTTMTLTASPAVGSTFAGWSGGGCSSASTCTVTVTAPTTVTATFTLNTYTLSVTKSGSGSVSSSPAGISCGADCTEVVNHGTDDDAHCVTVGGLHVRRLERWQLRGHRHVRRHGDRADDGDGHVHAHVQQRSVQWRRDLLELPGRLWPMQLLRRRRMHFSGKPELHLRGRLRVHRKRLSVLKTREIRRPK